MMRSRKIFFIAAFIGVWTFVTYFFLLRNYSDFGSHRKNVFEKLNYLENEVRAVTNKQNDLVRSLVEILKAKVDKLATTENYEGSEQLGDEQQIKKKSIENHHEIPAVEQPKLKELEDSNNKINNNNEDGSNIKEIPLFPLDQEKKSSENNKKEQQQHKVKSFPFDGPVIPVLVFACNRVSVSKCLDNLIEYRPNSDQFPIIVSQDCGDEATKKVIQSYQDEVTLIEQPDQSDITVPLKEKKFKGYYKIARHYGWALNTTFQKGYEFVIIVEDDLNVAPDFFEYFLGTYSLLQKDPSLWCVSAWNDNGKLGLIDTNKPELLYRTDFFPGLGWMLTKDLWKELSVKWPKSFWDDWIRHPEQRKGRACIRPEISRTRTFGKVGVSNGLFFDKYLKYIKLSEEYVEFSKLNLTYLLKENYDNTFVKEVYNSPVVTFEELRRHLITTTGPIRIQYNTKDQYKKTAKMLGLMDDFKSGVPRTGYRGIVSFFYNNQRVYLAPNVNWRGYDLSWS